MQRDVRSIESSEQEREFLARERCKNKQEILPKTVYLLR